MQGRKDSDLVAMTEDSIICLTCITTMLGITGLGIQTQVGLISQSTFQNSMLIYL
jgi:hypothetical protein